MNAGYFISFISFRIYSNNVDEKIYPNSNFIDDMVLYLPKKIFILKKIVITTLVTCMRYVFFLFFSVIITFRIFIIC